jgi:hypothetical protein
MRQGRFSPKCLWGLLGLTQIAPMMPITRPNLLIGGRIAQISPKKSFFASGYEANIVKNK